eukprot:4191695-Prymnesium_polylepis.1
MPRAGRLEAGPTVHCLQIGQLDSSQPVSAPCQHLSCPLADGCCRHDILSFLRSRGHHWLPSSASSWGEEHELQAASEQDRAANCVSALAARSCGALRADWPVVPCQAAPSLPLLPAQIGCSACCTRRPASPPARSSAAPLASAARPQRETQAPPSAKQSPSTSADPGTEERSRSGSSPGPPASAPMTPTPPTPRSTPRQHRPKAHRRHDARLAHVQAARARVLAVARVRARACLLVREQRAAAVESRHVERGVAVRGRHGERQNDALRVEVAERHGVGAQSERTAVARQHRRILVEQRLEGEDEDVRRRRVGVDESTVTVGADVDPQL